MNESLRCEVCGARVTNLRRGRCSICYLRWAESRPVGLGASCLVCGERRRDYLRLVEFQRTWLSMCHNCSARLFRLHPLPLSLAGLRSALQRERRLPDDRRDGQEDLRIAGMEQRAGDRRIPLVDSDFLEEEECVDAEDLIIEILEAPLGPDDPTRIIEAARAMGGSQGLSNPLDGAARASDAH